MQYSLAYVPAHTSIVFLLYFFDAKDVSTIGIEGLTGLQYKDKVASKVFQCVQLKLTTGLI